jgi:hypothetical protein
MIDPVLDAWCAGLFEGEGSIGIYRTKGNRHPSISVRVNMTDKPAVDRFFEIMAIGGVRRNKPRGKRRASWVWGVYNKSDCSHVIGRIYPWLVIKRKQADVALAFIRGNSGSQDVVRTIKMLKVDEADFQVSENQQLELSHLPAKAGA